jgi:pimeloyl-ACP methyl ester carboxylesterase
MTQDKKKKGPSGGIVCLLFGLIVILGLAKIAHSQMPHVVDGFMTAPDSVRIFYEHAKVMPEKGTMIFLHGWGMSYNEWSGIKEKFQDDGWSTFAFDFRGHGASTEAPERQLDYQKMGSRRERKKLLTDIGMALDHVHTGDNPVRLIGSSMGANYALRYAAEDERITGVVLISPFYESFGILNKKMIAKYGSRPILMIAAQNNSWSFRACLHLKNKASGPSLFYSVRNRQDEWFKDKTPFVSPILRWVNNWQSPPSGPSEPVVTVERTSDYIEIEI